MNEQQLVLIEDAGHGWLEVPGQTIIDLGIADQVSPFSYMAFGNVYLEEDCDMELYFQAIKAQTNNPEMEWAEFFKNEWREGHEFRRVYVDTWNGRNTFGPYDAEFLPYYIAREKQQ